jgi:serine protease AprX
MNIRAAIRHSTLPLLIIATALAAPGASGGAPPVTTSKIWIYFSDHGEASPQKLAAAVDRATLSPRSLERRRLRGSGAVRDVHDLPVSALYLERLRAEGLTLRRTSKYLNAVSALATPDQIARIRALPFVKKVTPVRSYHRKVPDVPIEEFERGPTGAAARGTDRARAEATLDYGTSFEQLNQINVIRLHDAGYHGEGVMIGIFDTGFMLRHEAFQHLDVAAQWDFIFNDGNTENDANDLSSTQHNHGTMTLSTIAGFKEGRLIGPAYAATYVLAKTERVYQEVIGEEDDYVRALEWADSIGVDVVTSSLGYYGWYDFADMDGNTAITTIACDIAASKGITVCTAAGNERLTSWGHIIAPSDGDSVIAVGAVDASGVVTYFSSPGPSADGRFKPDVAARGLAVTTVVPADSLGYTSYSNGTSFSTPLVAGACALILQMHGSWGPMDVLQALRSEASQSDSPDNDLGWGIIDAYQSALGAATGVAESLSLDVTLSGDRVSGSIFNGNATTQTLDVLRRKWRQDGNGYESTNVIAQAVVVPGSSYSRFSDRLTAGGVYDYVLRLTGNSLIQTEPTTVRVGFGATLSQSAPNPFVAGSTARTSIGFSVGGSPPAPGQEPPIGSYAEVRLEVFDVTGARVATLVDDIKSPGEYTVDWNGLSDRGTPVASGVYFYRLEVPGASLTRKLILIRR